MEVMRRKLRIIDHSFHEMNSAKRIRLFYKNLEETVDDREVELAIFVLKRASDSSHKCVWALEKCITGDLSSEAKIRAQYIGIAWILRLSVTSPHSLEAHSLLSERILRNIARTSKSKEAIYLIDALVASISPQRFGFLPIPGYVIIEAIAKRQEAPFDKTDIGHILQFVSKYAPRVESKQDFAALLNMRSTPGDWTGEELSDAIVSAVDDKALKTMSEWASESRCGEFAAELSSRIFYGIGPLDMGRYRWRPIDSHMRPSASNTWAVKRHFANVADELGRVITIEPLVVIIMDFLCFRDCILGQARPLTDKL